MNPACPTGCRDLIGQGRDWVCADCRTPIARYRDAHTAIEAMRARLHPERHWCASCRQTENPTGAHRVCPGCGHVWPTEADLVAGDLDVQRAGLAAATDVALAYGGAGVFGRAVAVERGDEVRCCPMCGHAFSDQA